MPRGKQKKIELPKYYIRLRDIRISLGLEIAEMAALVGIPAVTYLYHEQGKVLETPVEVLMKFSRLFGLSVDYLVGLTDVPAMYSDNGLVIGDESPDTSRVRACRIENGETGKFMGEHLDVTQGAYSTKELHPEKIRFNLLDLIRIAYFFNTSVDYLVKLTDERIPNPRGKCKRIPLGIANIMRIKRALGLAKPPRGIDEDAKAYCSEHFRIKAIRQICGFSQQEVADAIGMDQGSYCVQERNPYRFSAYHLIKLADFYGTSVDFLVGRSDKE